MTSEPRWHIKRTSMEVSVMAKASQLEQLAACRDLARRARRLAGAFLDDPDRDRLLRYAEEMETRAAELEQEAAQRLL
jgi:hypothetical protein